MSYSILSISHPPSLYSLVSFNLEQQLCSNNGDDTGTKDANMTDANAIRDRHLQCQTSLTADNENYVPPMHHLCTNPYRLQYQYQQCQRSHTLTKIATTLMGQHDNKLYVPKRIPNFHVYIFNNILIFNFL